MILYKKEDVEKIFNREKVLIGSKDVVPRYRAVEIFGKNAVNFSMRLSDRGSNGSEYGIGDYALHYLTRTGMEVAATYTNICNIKKMATGEGGATACTMI